MLNADKNALRKIYREKRQQLTPAAESTASDALCARIAALAIYQDAEKIALYQATHHEISLHPLWLLAESTLKTCYMPAIQPDSTRLLFLPTTSETPQKRNQFHILEPDIPHTEAIALEQLDLMILPLVAFNTNGTRLGQGAGYYDRTLEQTRPRCVLGAAYDFQQHPALHADPWDIPLDGIVTDKNTFGSKT